LIGCITLIVWLKVRRQNREDMLSGLEVALRTDVNLGNSHDFSPAKIGRS
jgi:hypothetical protein